MTARRQPAAAAPVRPSHSLDIGDVKVFCVELDYVTSVDLLSDLVAAIGPAGAVAQGQMSAEALTMMAGALVSGRLTELQARLLTGTTVVFPGEKVDIVDRDSLNRAFTGRKKYAIAVTKFALEVNFKDFLDGLALAGLEIQTLSRSDDSSPSTSATG